MSNTKSTKGPNERNDGGEAAQHIATASIILAALGYLGYGEHKKEVERDMERAAAAATEKNIDLLIADALANNRLQLDLLGKDGQTINLNALSPKDRATTIMTNCPVRYCGSGSYRVLISDTKQGYICSLGVSPGQLDRSRLSPEPIPELTAEQAGKYAEALGDSCGLNAKKVQAIKESLIGMMKVGAAPAGPYSSIATNGAVMEQRAVEPKVVTRG